ncbi:hypothetical protein GUITHDRAFT_117530 [Guillardia theta CCMP2712]|uniref:SHSP domain-containing protein n=1 Tax=Guillardia theta (strain CCMP2712) TaxID=905079 RepID=L1IJP0_GUITC|nr:hypothetical protein GUITHDRAFT_117530 [Guillardia theta CCMP2712]EKX36302.1 hypothetical protein GUITHDRAFT_117530 [Guillardia theta CCMP2712]|eukprot:XP_005823282.1 hypothetical protein GUITHDRAFT_117530 [Guillardia theta CCMP2712]
MPRLESLPDAHVVTMDTPGVAARDLALTLVGDRTLELVVSAGSLAASDRDDTEGSPRSSSSVLLRQRIALPSDADPRKIRSEYSDGRLRVEIARRSTAAHHRHITQVRDDDEEEEELVGLEASYASKRARLGELTEELRRERRELAGLESELRAARQEARRKRSSRRTLIAIERPAGEERKREETGENEEGKDRRAGVE